MNDKEQYQQAGDPQSTPPSGYQQTGTPQSSPHGGYQQAPPSAYGQPQETSTKAMLSLVLSIVGYFTLPVILHIVGIVLGNNAKQEIEQNPNIGGEGLATAGIVLGWIGVGIFVLILLLILVMFAIVGLSFQDVGSTLALRH